MMKRLWILALFGMATMACAWPQTNQTNTAGTTIVYAGYGSIADIGVYNDNLSNVLTRLDAMYSDARNPLSSDLQMYTNSLLQLVNLIGTTGYITNFTYYGNGVGLTNLQSSAIANIVLNNQNNTYSGSTTQSMDAVKATNISDVSTITVQDDAWIGLGASSGRIQFDDQSTDEVNILSAELGVGTAKPVGLLHVQDGAAGAVGLAGDMILESSAQAKFSIVGLNSQSNGVFFGSDQGVDQAELSWQWTGGDVGKTLTVGTKTVGGEIAFDYGTSLEGMRLSSAGYLGLGTNDPQYKFDLVGNGMIRGTLNMDANSITNLAAPTADQDAATKKYIDDIAVAGAQTVAGTNIIVGTNGSAYTVSAGTNIPLLNAFNVFSSSNSFSGNVGIGTAAPGQELEISSTAPAVRITDSDGGFGQIAADDGNLALQSDQGGAVASSFMKFQVDTAEAMRIIAGGNVGIGTNAPSKALDVNGSAIVRTDLDVDGAIYAERYIYSKGDVNTFIQFPSTDQMSFDSGGLEFLLLREVGDNLILLNGEDADIDTDVRWDSGSALFVEGSSGNVGIGTNAPGAKLDVNGASIMRDAVQLGVAGVSSGHVNVPEIMTINIDSDGTQSDRYFAIYKDGESGAGTELMRVQEDGNVGIGTNAPGDKLHVSGGDIQVYDTLPRLYLMENDSANNNYRLQTSAGKFAITEIDDDKGGATDRIVIDSSGNVGIGTNAPGYELHVVDSGEPNVGLTEQDTGKTWHIGVSGSDFNITEAGAAVRVTCEAGGNVGIGTASPSDKLQVVGDAVAATFQQTNFLCEADFKDDASQSFTAAGGFEKITNFVSNICHANYTFAHSNFTVTAAGWYRVYMTLSYDAGGASSIACHLFTNDVAAATPGGNAIGWNRDTSAVSQDGVTACEKTIQLSAGTIVDWRLDVDADETVTWKHGTVGIERRY